MSIEDVKVPDIGDFNDVPVIEILVKPGDTVAPEDALITLESDKASMDVPSPSSGKVVEVLVSVGDKVSEGTAILKLETGSADNASSGGDAKQDAKNAGSAPAAPIAAVRGLTYR